MRILIALTVLTGFMAAPFWAASPSLAQGVEGLEEINVEASMFPDTLRGCTKKALFRTAMADMYKKSKDPADLTDMKIVKPLIQNAYEEIAKSGVTPFNIKTLNDYQECGKKAQPDSRPEKQEKYAALHKACSTVNNLNLQALEAAKNKRSKDATLNSLGKTELDMKGTSLADMESPALYLAEQIFAKNEESYDDAVDFALKIGMDCLNRKD